MKLLLSEATDKPGAITYSRPLHLSIYSLCISNTGFGDYLRIEHKAMWC